MAPKTPASWEEAKLITSWHPTFAFFHNPYEWGAFRADLDRFARCINGKLESPPREILWKPRYRDVLDLYKQARRTGEPLACDIETGPETPSKPWTGKDPTRAVLRTIGLGTCSRGLSYRMDRGVRRIEKLLRRVLADPKATKVFHNGDWFDRRVLLRYGFPVENAQDTRDARRVVSSTSPLRLAHAGSIYTDYEPWKENEEDDEKGLVFTKSRKKLGIYNSHDCVVTARVWRGITQEEDWASARIQKLYQHQKNLARIAAKMHDHGIRVDRMTRKWLKWALLEEYNEKEAALKRAVAIPGFEANPNHMRALIFKSAAQAKNGRLAHLARFNLDDPMDPAMYSNKEMTTISVDEDALIALLIDPSIPDDLRVIIELYWDAQSVWKQRSTFVASAKVWHAIGKDGYLRPGWNSCGTDTGRFACKEPNVMNIEKILRAMYIASPGHVMVGGDYSQLELNVMRAISKDDVLGEALATGDVYTADAIDFFGLPPDTTKKTCKKEARKSAKIIHLGKQYGAGKKKVFQIALKQDRTMKWALASKLCDAFERRYQGTVAYWEREQARVEACGYSETRIMGRRRYYPRVPERTDTSNYPVQGTAADIKNIAMIELDRALTKHVPGASLIIDLHDALYVDAPKRRAGEVQRILEDTMQKTYEIDGDRYNFKVEAEAQERWSDFE